MKMLALRLQPGQDLKKAIETYVQENQLSAATVISAVGSLAKATIRMAGAQPDRQDIRVYDGSYEIVSLIGNLGPGRSHLHIAFSDEHGAVIGGHLKDGSLVDTTVELVLAVEDTLLFTERTDKTTGFGELHIKHD